MRIVLQLKSPSPALLAITQILRKPPFLVEGIETGNSLEIALAQISGAVDLAFLLKGHLLLT